MTIYGNGHNSDFGNIPNRFARRREEDAEEHSSRVTYELAKMRREERAEPVSTVIMLVDLKLCRSWRLEQAPHRVIIDALRRSEGLSYSPPLPHRFRLFDELHRRGMPLP